MLNKVVNGYTIIAAETDMYVGGIVVLGMRYNGPGFWEYVVGRMNNLDETEWFWGSYSGSDFGSGVEAAVKHYRQRLGG